MEKHFDHYIVKQSPPYLNYGLLKITDESRYSSLMPWHIDQVCQCILDETQNMIVNHIIDCNAHIGVDTILLRLLFSHADITAIELNPNTYQILKENMNNIDIITNDEDIKNINVINDDCLNYSMTPANIRYYDPPWQGTGYKQNEKINLYLSNIDIGVIVNTVLKYNPCLIILKLPYNIDMVSLYNKISYGLNYQIYFKTYNIYTSSGKLSYILAFIR